MEIPEEDDSDILKANFLPSVPDPEFCVRTTKDLTAQGTEERVEWHCAINNFLTVEKETHQHSDISSEIHKQNSTHICWSDFITETVHSSFF